MKITNVTRPLTPPPIQPKGMTLEIRPVDYVAIVGALRRLAGKDSLFVRTRRRRQHAAAILAELEIA